MNEKIINEKGNIETNLLIICKVKSRILYVVLSFRNFSSKVGK